MKLIIILILFLSGCVSGNVVKDVILSEEISKPLVYFCPRDNCSEVLAYYINNSISSVYCAFYDIDLENVLELLESKSNSIDVKIVVDDNNYDFGGKGIIKDTSSQLSHNKFCIFDNSIILTGSFNPTNNGAYKNNNNIVIVESSYLVNNYLDEFNELWNYNFGSGRKTFDTVVYLNGKKYENFFCPEDNCKEQVLRLLNEAETSIYFMTFSFTDFDIANLLVSKKDLDVRGVMESKRVNMQYNQYKNLVGKIDVRKDQNKYTMHHKVFIIDNRTVITGSYNPTKAANTKNDENILVIHDREIAKLFLDEFDELYGKD
jgi:phosphatidylserine/phosphatidylglycerophosphate/cardiolipin synthase-like enzyme